ncbi:MAG: hypothetical protein ACWGMZ_05090 [Thermoguttaceae bacterium]
MDKSSFTLLKGGVCFQMATFLPLRVVTAQQADDFFLMHKLKPMPPVETPCEGCYGRWTLLAVLEKGIFGG